MSSALWDRRKMHPYSPLMSAMNWYFATAIVALVVGSLVLADWHFGQALLILAPMALALMAIALYYRVAQSSPKEEHEKRPPSLRPRRPEAGADGDMSEVAGVVPRPPWMW